MKGQIIFAIIIFYSFQPLFAQTGELNADEWASIISRSADRKNEGFYRIDSLLTLTDSSKTFIFLDQLGNKGSLNADHFEARFNCLKAHQLYNKNVGNLYKVKPSIKNLFAEAIQKAYESEDEYLIAFVSSHYGGLIYHLGEMELSVMYSVNGVELNEKLFGTDSYTNYQSLADLLYKIKEYKSSVMYSLKAIAAGEKDPKGVHESALMSSMNTAALGYHRQGIYDSAFSYYKMALQKAHKIKNAVWVGIISGNMGQIYYQLHQYDTANTLLQLDYRTSKAAGYYDNAANSLQWSARTDLAIGNKSSALAQVREAFQLLKQRPDVNYLRNALYTATQVFKESGMYDSAYYYTTLYSALNDSLERVASLSSVTISKARLNDEKSRYRIQSLQQEKRSQLLQRNILIGAIVLLSFLIFIVINRQRLKTRLKMEMMEKEISFAKEQLQTFTHSIIEKTTLIEKLEEQVKSRSASEDQQMIITELSRHTILTEDDWLKFRTLFEKIYPGFFSKLKEKATDITVAEQRMAALTRLHLTNSQMAAILGISGDSVRKNRLRLKQRLGLSPESNLDDVINEL